MKVETEIKVQSWLIWILILTLWCHGVLLGINSAVRLFT